jgi:hypothetical protein
MRVYLVGLRRRRAAALRMPPLRVYGRAAVGDTWVT